MNTNTSKYIPYNCVSGILIKSENHPEYPFFSGTGFYVFFPPYSEIFFVTARHCIYNTEDELLGKIIVPLKRDEAHRDVVPFKEILTSKCIDDHENFEDIAVLVVGELPKEDKCILMARSLHLLHQEGIDKIIDIIMKKNENIRTIGFPGVSKEIDYENNEAKMSPRGFHGKINGKGALKNWYKFTCNNWKDGDLAGFSGSPVLELIPLAQDIVMPVPIGIIVTTSNFISINVATNLIATYIKAKGLA